MTPRTIATAPSTIGADEPVTDYLAYLDTLRDLGTQGAAVNEALLDAHVADTPQDRRAALVELHTRLRHMAATANEALGTGTPPAEPGHA